MLTAACLCEPCLHALRAGRPGNMAEPYRIWKQSAAEIEAERRVNVRAEAAKTLPGAEFMAPLENRCMYMYGVDQVPDPLCNSELETYDPIGAGSKQGVRVIVGKEGADTKRFCTIQIFHRMTGSGKLGTTHSDVVGV